MDRAKGKPPISVAVINQKGGSGKTTLATHIARGLYLQRNRVLLIDSDPQGSARDWHAASERDDFPVVGLDRPTLEKDLPRIAAGYNWIIVDGAPQLHNLAVSALNSCDIVLIPVQPSPYDAWATADLLEMLQERQAANHGRPRAAFVLCRQIPNARLSNDVRQALEKTGTPVFKSGTHQRVIYATSAASGATALDREPRGKAANEIRAIIKELRRFTNA